MGYEVVGLVRTLGPDTELASGGGAAGDEVVASVIDGGYAKAITVPASSVFAKPSTLTFPEAASLLLVGTTAAHLLHTSGAKDGETVLLHGAAGAVGVSVLQQARLLSARVIGTASPADFEFVQVYGGIPVAYGPGLLDRFPFDDAPAAFAALTGSHPPGKLALINDRQLTLLRHADGPPCEHAAGAHARMPS